MKILKSNENSTPTSYEIPNSTIAWGTVIIALIQALVTFGSNYIAARPKATEAQTVLIAKQNFQLKLLQTALSSTDSKNRSNSLRLIIDAGLIDDPNNKLLKLADSDNVPQWAFKSDTLNAKADVPNKKNDSEKPAKKN